MNTSIFQEQQEIDNNQFAKKIALSKDTIIPVICDDMIEFVKEKEMKSIQDFIWVKFKDYLDEKDCDFIYHYLKSNFYYGITCLEKCINSKGFAKKLYDAIAKGFHDGELRLKDEVVTFLKNGQFPLIITTLCFTIIEETVYNAKTKTEIDNICRWYYPKDKNIVPLVSPSGHVVYHIFGGNTPWSWVYNEQELLRFMHAFHHTDYGAKNLFNSINNKIEAQQPPQQLLVLGSILPDWLFRFLIYPLYENNIKESGGMWLSLDSITTELSSFLGRNGYDQKTQIRPTEREQLQELLNIPEPDNTRYIERGNHIIFFSYKSDDAVNAERERIEEMLRDLVGVENFWKDTDINPETGEKNIQHGDNYWDIIEQNIDKCTLFIPLITWTYLNDFVESCSFDELTKKDNNTLRSILSNIPVVLEAFYALSKGKKVLPIVIRNSFNQENEELSPKKVEELVNKYVGDMLIVDPNKINLSYKLLKNRDMYYYDENNIKLIELPTLN